ncbi:MAG: helix-turn-helix domain-containing protein [Spirochaetaceae bacterium]|nr:helix-turn-helix domain-containing protein [Spirochaetaceae bacterium]
MNQTIVSNGNGEQTDLLVRQEELILDVTERLTEALDNAGITKGELAERLGKSPGFVSQVFGGGRNLTLRTVSDIAAALSLRPMLHFVSERDPMERIAGDDAQGALPVLQGRPADAPAEVLR